jgi:sigma-B regulation protein RsbQ
MALVMTPVASPVRRRNNVTVHGSAAGRPVLLSHGFGCDQSMWSRVVPGFVDDHQVVLFDHVGAGASDLTAYDRGKYASLHGYADDLLEIIEDLDLRDVVFVGHSVSAMIGVLAAIRDPSRFGDLVLVGPSPRYLDDAGYVGGFDRAAIESLLDSLDANHLGWSAAMAPVIAGNADRPEVAAELEQSFCRTDPAIARDFARATFLSDNRRDLPKVTTPTLILQCSDDAIAPLCVGQYVHAAIDNSDFTVLSATGHCPNLSAPEELVAAIRAYLDTRSTGAR